MEKLEIGMEVRIGDMNDPDGVRFTAKVLDLRKRESGENVVIDVLVHVNEHNREGWILSESIGEVVKNEDGSLKILMISVESQVGC